LLGSLTHLEINLVGSHSLWGHKLWNAGQAMSYYIDAHPTLCSGKNVLELGAAAGVPSLICALNAANMVFYY
jgi:nicotinamide N-methyltransferase